MNFLKKKSILKKKCIFCEFFKEKISGFMDPFKEKYQFCELFLKIPISWASLKKKYTFCEPF
jgi:hypothetical protein